MYRFFEIYTDKEIREWAFVPLLELKQTSKYASMEEEKDESENKITVAKDLQEEDMPMVFELLSELPSTCSISSDSAKRLALEIKNLREEKAVLEEKFTNIEKSFLRMEVGVEKRNKEMDEMMKVVRELQVQLSESKVANQELKNEVDELTLKNKILTSQNEHLLLTNENLQTSLLHYEQREAKLKEAKKLGPVNASASRYFVNQHNNRSISPTNPH